MKSVLLLPAHPPFLTDKEIKSEGLNDLPKATQLESNPGSLALNFTLLITRIYYFSFPIGSKYLFPPFFFFLQGASHTKSPQAKLEEIL